METQPLPPDALKTPIKFFREQMATTLVASGAEDRGAKLESAPVSRTGLRFPLVRTEGEGQEGFPTSTGNAVNATEPTLPSSPIVTAMCLWGRPGPHAMEAVVSAPLAGPLHPALRWPQTST